MTRMMLNDDDCWTKSSFGLGSLCKKNYNCLTSCYLPPPPVQFYYLLSFLKIYFIRLSIHYKLEIIERMLITVAATKSVLRTTNSFKK